MQWIANKPLIRCQHLYAWNKFSAFNTLWPVWRHQRRGGWPALGSSGAAHSHAPGSPLPCRRLPEHSCPPPCCWCIAEDPKKPSTILSGLALCICWKIHSWTQKSSWNVAILREDEAKKLKRPLWNSTLDNLNIPSLYTWFCCQKPNKLA